MENSNYPKLFRYRRPVFWVLGVLLVLSIYGITKLKFSFDFEQFFPQGDPDLIFFQSFIKEFEADDNFMLVAVTRDVDSMGVFEQRFLQRFDSLTAAAQGLPFVKQTTSLTSISLPLKTSFGITAIPAIHVDDPESYPNDRAKLLRDERFVKNLISADGKSLVLLLKTKEKLTLPESQAMLAGLDSLMATTGFKDFHYLGRANFQKELVQMEQREVATSTVVAAFLVGIIMMLIFRRFWSVFIALFCIGLSMILFLGLLGLTGRGLSVMAALYPVLIVIIGTADVIHMMSKYIDELRHGHDRELATWLTIKEIGLATFMTAITTAVGFATLVTNRIVPIQEFGINAAVGVMVAYVTVLLTSTVLLSYFELDQLTKLRPDGTSIFDRIMEWVYQVTKKRPRQITLIAFAILGVCIYGVSKIQTNYSIRDNLPNRSKVTEDFMVFEKIFAGFRPLEYGVFAQNGHKADDFEVMQQVGKVEDYIKQNVPSIRSVNSETMVFKSLNMMNHNNRFDEYRLPTDKDTFDQYKKMADQLPGGESNILLSKDRTKTRIATRILDLGADTVMAIGDKMDRWIAANTDSTVAKFRRTGTGYIIDKNGFYIRADLLEGILWEVGLIALLMGLLLRNFRMIVIFLIPNLFPLIFAGALLGFLGVDLDAGISMIFTVVFGIAIDDTIHFLSSFKLNHARGITVDEALHQTLLETGKPVLLTTMILFFGFLVMIFSVHPPSVTVGKLIAVTLVTALASDLFINPLLIRWWIKDVKKQEATTPVEPVEKVVLAEVE